MRRLRFENAIWILFGIFTLNFILKFLFIEAPSVGGDEPFSIFYAQTDFQTLLELSKQENNPPFFTILLKVWTSFFGISPVSVRFLPLIFSSLTASFIFLMTRELTSTRFGIIGAAIFTFSNYHIQFSHEARPYALFGLLTIMALYYTYKLLQTQQRKWLILTVLVNTLLIYNHFFGFFVLLIQLFMLVLLFRKDNPWKQIAIAWGITSLFYLPYLPFLLKRFMISSEGGTWLTIPKPEELYSIFVKFSNVPVVAAFSLLLLIIGIVINRLVWRDAKFLFLAVSLFVPLLFIFLVSQYIPMFLDRYLVFLGIVFILALTYFLSKIQIRAARISIIVLILLGFVLTIDPTSGNKAPDKELVEALIENRKNKAQTLIAPPYYAYNFVYHFEPDWMLKPETCWQQMNNENIRSVQNLGQLQELKLENECFLVAKGPEKNAELLKVLKKLDELYLDKKELFSEEGDVVLYYSGLIDLK
ncbi:MAG: glycosyltransferase family 39 protein [Crocinitomicaceae bacterium]